MKRSRNLALATLMALGTSLVFSQFVQAGGCSRGGGGHRGGFHGGGRHFRSSISHRHIHNNYHAPSYAVYPPSYPAPQPLLQPAAPAFPQSQPIASAPQPQSVAGGPVGIGQPEQPAINSAHQSSVTTLSPSTGSSTGDAESSALDALGGFAPPTDSAPDTRATTQPALYVGTWTANLKNGARVQLELEAAGRFRWVATSKNSRTSSFEGTYTVENGSLTLIRAEDNQKLAGNMNQNGENAFRFKLAGTTNAAALEFNRG